MIAEFALAVAALALAVNNYRARDIQNRDQKLLAEHSAMAESLLESGSPFQRDELDPWYKHDWSESTKDVIYTSKLPWSYDQVIVEVKSCNKCQTVSRHIVKGLSLARKKALQFEEGFYYSGAKFINPGCPFPDEPETWQDSKPI